MAHKFTAPHNRRFRPAPDERLGADGDVVIVGAGLAGLFTALKLAPLPVTVLAAAPLGQGSSTGWAQGGVAAAVGSNDNAASHANDTIAAGAGIVDADVANFVAAEGPARIADLVAYGVPFDRERRRQLCAEPGGRALASPRRARFRRPHRRRHSRRADRQGAGDAVDPRARRLRGGRPDRRRRPCRGRPPRAHRRRRQGSLRVLPRLRRGSGDGRHRRPLRGHDQPAVRARRVDRHGGARRRNDRRRRVRAVPSHRHRRRPRSGTTGHGSAARRGRHAGECGRRTLHDDARSARRAGAARCGCARRVHRGRRRPRRLPRLPRGDRRPLRRRPSPPCSRSARRPASIRRAS